MKVDFSKNNTTTATPVTEISVPTQIKSDGVVTTDDSICMAGDYLPGFSELMLPKINIVQALGGLKDSFVQGAVVFGQSIVLFEPAVLNKATSTITRPATAPINVTILGLVRPTRYVEKVEGGGERGMLVNTEDDVRASGGTLDWKEWNLKKASGIKLFQPIADILVAIARPEIVADDDTVFSFPVGTDKYTIALWHPKASVYTAACKSVIFPARKLGVLRRGYPTHSFNLTTRLKAFYGTNESWVPVLVPRERSTPEFLEFAKAILNPAG